MQALRLCFAGTPAFAAGHLDALIASEHEVAAVYTQPDRPRGRGKKTEPSAVKSLAENHGLPVLQPPSLKDAASQEQMAALQADVLIVVAYGLILPPEILAIPRLGCLNVHASLLPRWRGAAPIERAILAGDQESGVTIMLMDEGLDTGPMLQRAVVPIGPEDNRQDLENKLLEAGKSALMEVLANLESSISRAEPQDHGQSSYAAKLDKSESRVDWSLPGEAIDRLIRATVGRQPAWAILDDQRIRLLEGKILSSSSQEAPGSIVQQHPASFVVSTTGADLEISRVQLPGRKAMSVREVSNARPALFSIASRFADEPA